MIKSFGCKETKKIFTGVFSRKFPANIQTRAFNKLAALHETTLVRRKIGGELARIVPLKEKTA
jgi:plasmid maintenance system killer protein